MNFGTPSAEQIQLEQASFITKVYGWMSLALVVTGITAVLVASSPTLINIVVGNRLVFFGLIIGELALVSYLAAAVHRMSADMAILAFLSYALLNGLTLSVLFAIYTQASIASTFFITAGTFAAMSAYGYFTKRDLTSLGNLLFMALIGLVISSLINLFFRNEMIYWITTYAGVLIFVGLTAYDTQKIKEMNIIGNEGTEEDKKEAISGALILYLDFINLFIYLLRLLGQRK